MTIKTKSLLLSAGIGTVALVTTSLTLRKNGEISFERFVPQEVKAKTTANPQRDAYFGDIHLHTTLSFDAFTFGTKTTPEQAYRHAKGDTVYIFGKPIKKKVPYDFLAVTDHSEFIGVLNKTEDPSSPLYDGELIESLKGKDLWSAFGVTGKVTARLAKGEIQSKSKTEQLIRSNWQIEIDAANQNYEPGKFTTFAAYEWTSMINSANLHRVVLFKDKPSAFPYSANESKRPEDLWSFLDANRKQGIEGLAIPHNSNVSDGLMFNWVDSDGKEITQDYAQKRIANEPLVEISQNKGQSETHPAFSPNDEFADFEQFENLLSATKIVGKVPGSFVRDGLGRGLVIEQKTKTNPYKFGFVGASDYHGGISTEEEYHFTGKINGADSSLKIGNELKTTSGGLDFSKSGSANITGVWAEENTRESIYNAFRRKEVYGTSGPRIKLRFFASWNYNKDLLKNPEWVKEAYANGVTQGSDLPTKPQKTKAPQFVIWAIKDPNAGNLDRVQVIKVWVKNGKQLEKVYNVALADGRKVDAKGKTTPVGNTVNVKSATYTNTIGDTELGTVWQDPEFDASLSAVYYARVLEIPTPRWTTYLAARNGKPAPQGLPASIQERAWSSPIWYTPSN